MKFTILGSGGCVALPKPLCQCNICVEAREKGAPYSRFGCSLYLEDEKILVDTPEDIVHALNFANIQEINHVFFSHMDPDHTLGMRIFEHLRLNWFDISEGRECEAPIRLHALPHVMEDLNQIGTKHGALLDYYDDVRNLVKREIIVEPLLLEDLKITFVRAGVATVFVFEKNGKKLLYAPCDVKPFPEDSIFMETDILLIGNTVTGDVLKGGYRIPEGNFLKEDLFSMKEIQELKEKYKIKKVVITHIEEDWGKSYDEYVEYEKILDNISFAYDGMILEL